MYLQHFRVAAGDICNNSALLRSLITDKSSFLQFNLVIWVQNLDLESNSINHGFPTLFFIQFSLCFHAMIWIFYYSYTYFHFFFLCLLFLVLLCLKVTFVMFECMYSALKRPRVWIELHEQICFALPNRCKGRRYCWYY